MDILDLLTSRRSSKSLIAPAPDALQLEMILQAATQAPDHGNLTPWRFVVIHTETGRQRFRQALYDTVTTLNMGEEALKKAERIGNYAPITIAVICTPKKGKPEWEQQLSSGCAAYAIQLAAKAQGFDSVWLTGLWANSPILKERFACAEQDKIIALLMLGTAQTPPDAPKNTDISQFTSYW